MTDTRNELEQTRLKVSTLEASLYSMQGTDDNVRNALKEATRKLVTVEVNQMVLARKYNLVSTDRELELKNKNIMERDFNEMQKFLKTRILYLELWKRGSLNRMAVLERNLSTWVPEKQLVSVQRELDNIRGRYQLLLTAIY